MDFTIRPMEPEDLPAVVVAWNENCIYDKCDENKFKWVFLDDPNYEKGSILIALKNNDIVGFAACATRDSVLGRDKMGMEEYKDYGFIHCIFAKKEPGHENIENELLKRIMSHIRSKNKKTASVVIYTGRYFVPGVDFRYSEQISVFEKNGFKKLGEIQDVKVDLASLNLDERLEKARAKMKEKGITVKLYEPDMLPMMHEFITALRKTSWFPSVWEEGFDQKRHTFVAFKEGKILGYGDYHWVNPEQASFGPTAVLPDIRGGGIGSCILLECMAAIKNMGTIDLVAGWARISFYIRNGWHVCREYVVFVKDVS